MTLLQRRVPRRPPPPPPGRIVLLHGFLGAATDWDPIAADLRADYDVIAPDLPGHGTPVDEAIPGDIDGMSASVWMKLGGEDRVILAGYSLGGRVALRMALQCPRRMEALILISSTPGLKDPMERTLRRDADERLADRLEREPFDQWLQNWYRQPVFASLALRPGGVEEMVRRRLAGNPARLAQVLRRCSPGRIAPVWKALPRLPCPVLYIAGADDRTYVRIGRRVVQAVGRAMIREIPGAGHPVHVERPDIVAAAMREFIGKLPARRARKEIV